MSGFGSPTPERLAEVLGHELRNPLASAVASLSVVAAMTETGDPRADFLNQALADLNRASNTLTGYLGLARAEAGSARFDTLPVNVEQLATRVVARYPDRDIHLVPQAGLPQVEGDVALLERAIENLLDNSFEGGADRVTLEISADQASVRLVVTDNGTGIPEGIRGRVFEPAVSGRGSTGLGLSIIRDIVQAHGGDVAFQTSDAGTVFRIGLPRV